MAEAKTKKEIFISPVGRAVWPKLNEPDTKFKPEGEFNVKLQLSEEVGTPLVEKFDAAIAEQYEVAKRTFAADPKNKGKSFANSKLAKYADKPYSIGEGDLAGTITFNFKALASGVSKKTGKPWKKKIALFDAKLAPLPVEARVGGGSTIKVAYTMNPFSTPIGTGLSLRLESVQVLELREYSRDAKSFGFGEEEGFSVNETDAATATDADETDEAAQPATGADF